VSSCVWTSGTVMCLPVSGRVGLGCVYQCVDERDWDVSPVCRRVGLGCIYLSVDEWDWDVSTCM
jgi:hypothetical protein